MVAKNTMTERRQAYYNRAKSFFKNKALTTTELLAFFDNFWLHLLKNNDATKHIFDKHDTIPVLILQAVQKKKKDSSTQTDKHNHGLWITACQNSNMIHSFKKKHTTYYCC